MGIADFCLFPFALLLLSTLMVILQENIYTLVYWLEKVTNTLSSCLSSHLTMRLYNHSRLHPHVGLLPNDQITLG